jgi:hypothetical protein
MEAWRHGGMEVSPNPCRDDLHVRLNMDDGRFYKDLDLRIYDIFGRSAPSLALPHTGEGGVVVWTVDVSTLPAGIYFVAVMEDGKQVAVGKFVVAGR